MIHVKTEGLQLCVINAINLFVVSVGLPQSQLAQRDHKFQTWNNGKNMLQSNQTDNVKPRDDSQGWDNGRVSRVALQPGSTIDSKSTTFTKSNNRDDKQGSPVSPFPKCTALHHTGPSHLTNHVPSIIDIEHVEAFHKLYNGQEDSSPSRLLGLKRLLHQRSISDNEVHTLLQTEITSLEKQQQTIYEQIGESGTRYSVLYALDLQSLSSCNFFCHTSLLASIEASIKSQRSEILLTLACSGGDSKNEAFISAVETIERVQLDHTTLSRELDDVSRVLRRRHTKLEKLCTNPYCKHTVIDSTPRVISSTSNRSNIEGQWFTLTKPTYDNCLGFNDEGNPMYTIGRMSFEMFRPGNLVVSIEAVFNPVEAVADKRKEVLTVPKDLQEEVQCILQDDGSVHNQTHILRTYQ